MDMGTFGCWAQKAGQYSAQQFPGTPTGLNEALAHAATIVPPLAVANGCVTVFPSTSGFTQPTIPFGVVLVVIEGGRYRVFGPGGEISVAATNVLNYPTFQAAVDATPTGGSLYIPIRPGGGEYSQNTVPAWTGAVVARPMRIFGESEAGVVLHWFGTGANNTHHWNITGNIGVTLESFTVVGTGTALPGCGDLIRWYKPASNMWDLTLRQITLLDPPAWGIKVMCDQGFFFQKFHTQYIQHGAYNSGPGGGGTDTTCPSHPYFNKPTGSGDLWLGGGASTGGNNCRIEDHELQGPSYGSWDTGRNLPAITCNLSGTTITRASGSFYADRVYVDAVVTGTGIPANTKVVTINSATSITVNNSMTNGSGISCTFDERQQYGLLHLDQLNQMRLKSVSFQGQDKSPSVSMRYFCVALGFEGLYIETLVSASTPENDHRFVIDGTAHALYIDLRYYKSSRGVSAGAPANRSSRFLKTTDGATMRGAKLANGVIYRWDNATTPGFTGPFDDIDLALDAHELVLDNLTYFATDGNVYDAVRKLGTARKGVEQALPGVQYVTGVSGQNLYRLIPVAKSGLTFVQDGTIVLDTDGKYYARRAGAWEALH